MQPALQTSLLRRIGSWEQIYSQHMELRSPNSSGECRGTPPWSDYVGSNADSFSVNTLTGAFFCHSTRRTGGYVQFRSWLDGHLNEHGELIPLPHSSAERLIAREIGMASDVDRQWVAECNRLLCSNEGLALRENLMRVKYWPLHILQELQIGYDAQSDRYVIPIYDERNEIINCRMYQPNAGDGQPKIRWMHEHYGGNLLYPALGWAEQQMIIVEGESDVISLRALGYPAVSGTHGGHNPVPDGTWYQGRTVYVLTDSDEVGQQAALTICRIIARSAFAVMRSSLPDWPGKPENADISDFIHHMIRGGHSQAAVQQMILGNILIPSVQVNRNQFDFSEPTETTFSDALNGSNIGQRIKFSAKIVAHGSARYMMPTRFNINCLEPGTRRQCERCPLARMTPSQLSSQIGATDYESIRTIRESRHAIMDFLKLRTGIPRDCPTPDYEIIEAQGIDSAVLIATKNESSWHPNLDKIQRDALVHTNPDIPILPNREYEFVGTLVAQPKTNAAVYWLDTYRPLGAEHEHFVNSPEKIEMMKQFRVPTGSSVFDHLRTVAQDLSNNVTCIYERDDVHMVYRTVWHSPIEFSLGTAHVKRGWIELMVIGDTRCGKSSTFRALSDWYGIGQLIDCKNQTIPGILGTTTRNEQGEWYVVAGVLPQNDRGIVCFDEFTSFRGTGLVEALSSTRSEGAVRISKAATAEFPARVRSIWLANPGQGELMSDMAVSGVEMVSNIIPQPEDIARFDLGLAVSQADMDVSSFHRPHERKKPTWGLEATRHLLAWTYSRSATQIVFTPEAEAHVYQISEWLCSRYSPKIPFVEPADQRNRVAKIAVSVAAQCFSTDDTHEMLIVHPTHVDAACQIMLMCYDKPTMAYDKYSARVLLDDTLPDPETVRGIFDALNHERYRVASELLRLDGFNAKMLPVFASFTPITGATFIQQMFTNRCIRINDKVRGEMCEKTPAFIHWLKSYIAEGNITTS